MRWRVWRRCTPRIPLISTVGQTNGAAPAFDADYWAANLRNPVRFSQAVAAAAEDHATFVEDQPPPATHLRHRVTRFSRHHRPTASSSPRR